MAESEEELKRLLMKVKQRVKKLAQNSTFIKLTSSGPFTSWQIDGETMETVTDFIFLGSQITVDCEIKKHLLLGRKPVTNLDNLLKSRDITLSTNVHLVKAMGFSSSHVWI